MTPPTLTQAHVGRRVLVEAVLKSLPDNDGDAVVHTPYSRGNHFAYCLPSAIREILPDEPKAGDRFINKSGDGGAILMVHKDRAFVEFDNPFFGSVAILIDSIATLNPPEGAAT